MPCFSSYCKTLHGALLVTTAAFLCTAIFLGWWRTNNQYAQQPADTWVLVGGITNTTAEFRSLGLQTLAVAENPQLLNPVFTLDDDINGEDSIPQATTVTGLQPSTQYYYVVNNALIGRFRTASPPGTRQNLTVALGGCAMTGSNNAVFDRIRRHDPDLFLHLGDFHYEDIAAPDLERRLDAIATVLGSPSQAQLYRSTGLVSMWDDHDWLGNNAATDTVKDAVAAIPIARQSYTMAFPHYPLAAAADTTSSESAFSAGIYHAFTWGTIRFVVSDLRSESTASSMYSDEQREWLQEEISQADQYDFLVWLTTKPWIGEGSDDAWAGNPEDRTQVSDWLSAVPSRNVLAVSADAHMLALDDGLNTFYGANYTESDVVYSFPILHSGPLDRVGSPKGGPYTQQCVAADNERNHQYSVLSFDFLEDQDPCLRIEAFRFNDLSGEELVFERSWCGELYGVADTTGASTTDACTIPSFSSLTQSLLYSAIGLLVLSLIATLWLVRPWPDTLGISIIMVVGWGLVLVLSASMPWLRGYRDPDVQPPCILVGVQATVYLLLVIGFLLRFQRRREHS